VATSSARRRTEWNPRLRIVHAQCANGHSANVAWLLSSEDVARRHRPRFGLGSPAFTGKGLVVVTEVLQAEEAMTEPTYPAEVAIMKNGTQRDELGNELRAPRWCCK
jgi:hypothetical protein